MSPIVAADQQGVALACAALARGDLVGMPTETVYGLAADAANEPAIERVFAAKGRPVSRPLIVHVPDLTVALPWLARPDPVFEALAERFWPGPLSLIVTAAATVSRRVTGGASTVALRAPAHRVAQALLRAYGRALVAPSANRYQRLSPTTAQAVAEELPTQVELILDGGPCLVGIESTVLDLTQRPARIRRPGTIGSAQLASVLGYHPILGDGALSPGADALHYAPQTPVRVFPYRGTPPAGTDDAQLRFGRGVSSSRVKWLDHDPAVAAAQLYGAMRELDRAGAACIWVEHPPAGGHWLALADRIARSAGQGATSATPRDD